MRNHSRINCFYQVSNYICALSGKVNFCSLIIKVANHGPTRIITINSNNLDFISILLLAGGLKTIAGDKNSTCPFVITSEI